MSKLRVSMTLPGAISLGAYEGGALAALLVAAKALGEDLVVVDSIAAASAGSITALLAARSLLRNVDPVTLLTKAWVELDSFNAMKTHSLDSPLSGDSLSKIAAATVGPDGVPDGPVGGRQQQSIHLSFALANLAGMTYDIPTIQAGTTVQATTNLDWFDAELGPADDAARYLEIAPFALASGANAIGFPPKNLDRSADRQKYLDAGLQGFPADGRFWYTDGGTVNNEPLGRTIDLVGGIPDDPDAKRLYLLIHPDPSAPADATSGPWSGDSPQPSWTHTGTHAIGMGRSQSIYEDLRKLQKTNSRLEWSRSIADAVESGVAGAVRELGLSVEQAQTLRGALTDAARTSLATVRAAQEATTAAAGRPTRPRDDPGPTLENVLSALVDAATGLEGRNPITVEVVSPLLQATAGQRPADLLAGLFLFHFGGFLDIKFRRSDFALGYRNMRHWLEHDLARHLPAGTDLGPARAAVTARYDELGWDHIDWGGAGFGALSGREQLQLAELAFHVGHVVANDVHKG